MPHSDSGDGQHGEQADQPDDLTARWASADQGWNQPPIVELGQSEQEWPAPPGYPPPEYQPPGYPVDGQPAAGYQPAGYQPAGYQPADYQAPGYQLPGWQPAAAPARRKLPWILGSILAVLLLAVSGAAFAAYQTLNGGGTQPDEVLPASAVAFAKLDLNPSAGQKIAAAQFLNRIPKLSTGFSSTGDWRKPLFDALARDGALPKGVSFERDIKPWLGRRIGVAVLPTKTEGTPDLVLAIQSTDNVEARAGVARFGSDYGMDFLKGYAIIARDVLVADRAIADAKAAPLKDSTRYHADLGQLGGLGVSTGWVDLAGVAKLAGPNATDLGLSGRLAYTVRFSAKAVELIAKSFGQQTSQLTRPSGLTGIADLPASTGLALQTTGLAGQLDKSWQQLNARLGSLPGVAGAPVDPFTMWQQQFGLDLPGDLDTLLGSSQLLAVDAASFGGHQGPRVGVRTWTDGKAAVGVLDKLAAGFGPSFPVHYRVTDDGVVAGTDDGYLTSLTAPTGPRLATVAGFKDALPDLAGAPVAGYLNLDAIAASLRANGADSQTLQQLAPFRAVGMTVRQAGGISTIRLRLVER
ncbi:MAG: DUF3352 domain-containing protein [Jatrophihabitantaceae bacterium]